MALSEGERMSSLGKSFRVLVSGCSEDRELMDQLVRQLKVLAHSAKMDIWTADRIQAGEDRLQEFASALERADLALVLISAEFLQDLELRTLFERRQRAGLNVIPVLLRACLWQEDPWLKDLEPLPANNQFITSLARDEQDRALAAVAAEVLRRTGAEPIPIVPSRRQLSSDRDAPFCPACAEPTVLRKKLSFRKSRYQCADQHCRAAKACLYIERQPGGTVRPCSWYPGETAALWMIFVGLLLITLNVSLAGVTPAQFAAVAQHFSANAARWIIANADSTTTPNPYIGSLPFIFLGLSVLALGTSIPKRTEQRVAEFLVWLLVAVFIAVAAGASGTAAIGTAAAWFGIGALLHTWRYRVARAEGLLPYETQVSLSRKEPSRILTWDILLFGAGGLLALGRLLSPDVTPEQRIEAIALFGAFLTYAAVRISLKITRERTRWLVASGAAVCGCIGMIVAGVGVGKAIFLALAGPVATSWFDTTRSEPGGEHRKGQHLRGDRR